MFGAPRGSRSVGFGTVPAFGAAAASPAFFGAAPPVLDAASADDDDAAATSAASPFGATEASGDSGDDDDSVDSPPPLLLLRLPVGTDPFDDFARICCVCASSERWRGKKIEITVQLPPQDEASLTRAVLHSEVSISMLLKKVSTREATARDPAAEAMIRAYIVANGGYDAVDAAVRAQLQRALVIPAHSSAMSAASRSELRAVVLTEGQGALVRRIFYDIETATWRRGRWLLNVPASSGKSYIAVHLVGQLATARDGGPTLYLCHHERMQKLVVKQVALELRKELGLEAEIELAQECAAVRDATWVRTPIGAPREAQVIVATIDAMVELATIDVLSASICTTAGGDGGGDLAARVLTFLPPREAERLCFLCATSARWHGRFSGGGVVVDESQLVFGREARAGVAGQHRLPAGGACVVIVRWAEGRGGGGGGGGRLAMLGDANQLNENPYDAEATEVWLGRCPISQNAPSPPRGPSRRPCTPPSAPRSAPRSRRCCRRTCATRTRCATCRC